MPSISHNIADLIKHILYYFQAGKVSGAGNSQVRL